MYGANATAGRTPPPGGESSRMAVADAKGRRWDAATGIGFVVVGAVAFILPGTPPKADDSSQEVAKFFVDKRDELLTSSALWLLAFAFFLWFLGSLRSYLRAAEGGEGRLSAAAFGGGVAAAALILAAICALNAGAFKVADETLLPGDLHLIRSLYDFSNALVSISGAGFLVLFAAASCSAARSGALPPWLYWFGSVVGVLQLLGGVGLVAESGAFAVGGAFTAVVPCLSFLWILAASIVLMQRAGTPPVARAEP
jgi:hypothetical protein